MLDSRSLCALGTAGSLTDSSLLPDNGLKANQKTGWFNRSVSVVKDVLINIGRAIAYAIKSLTSFLIYAIVTPCKYIYQCLTSPFTGTRTHSEISQTTTPDTVSKPTVTVQPEATETFSQYSPVTSQQPDLTGAPKIHTATSEANTDQFRSSVGSPPEAGEVRPEATETFSQYSPVTSQQPDLTGAPKIHTVTSEANTDQFRLSVGPLPEAGKVRGQPEHLSSPLQQSVRGSVKKHQHLSGAEPDNKLQRFLQHQDRLYYSNDSNTTYYDQALLELQNGQKRGHWCWYTFPQVAGLGVNPSQECLNFEIKSLHEAQQYWSHPTLQARLLACCNAVNQHAGRPIEDILGGGGMGKVDALKLHACATLFYQVSGGNPVFKQILHNFYNDSPHQKTLQTLSAWQTLNSNVPNAGGG